MKTVILCMIGCLIFMLFKVAKESLECNDIALAIMLGISMTFAFLLFFLVAMQ